MKNFKVCLISLLLLTVAAWAGPDEDKETIRNSSDPIVTLQSTGGYSRMIVSNVHRGDLDTLHGRQVLLDWGDSEPDSGNYMVVMMEKQDDGSYKVHPGIRYQGLNEEGWIQGVLRGE